MVHACNSSYSGGWGGRITKIALLPSSLGNKKLRSQKKIFKIVWFLWLKCFNVFLLVLKITCILYSPPGSALFICSFSFSGTLLTVLLAHWCLAFFLLNTQSIFLYICSFFLCSSLVSSILAQTLASLRFLLSFCVKWAALFNTLWFLLLFYIILFHLKHSL